MSVQDSGKVVIVTGAGGGIGEATARRFGRDGYHVVLSDLPESPAAEVAKDIGAVFVPADVTSEGQVASIVQAAMDSFGRLDVMINNAGVSGAKGSIADIAQGDWSRTLAVLVDSVFFGMKHAARAIKTGGRGGAILSTASMSGFVAIGPHAYITAKHAVVGLTRSVASELAAHRIRVNAVGPGYVPTPMTYGFFGGREEARKVAAVGNPLPNIIEPEEIAGAFAYLAGDDARNITGQVMIVDAGFTQCRQNEDFYLDEPRFTGSPYRAD